VLSDQSTLQREFPVRAIGACFAIAAFAVAITAGLSAQREAEAILTTAILAMFVCQPIGIALGFALKHATFEQVQDYKDANPIPEAFDPPKEGSEIDGVRADATDAQESQGSRTESS
jgi:hypothetical protein